MYFTHSTFGKYMQYYIFLVSFKFIKISSCFFFYTVFLIVVEF